MSFTYSTPNGDSKGGDAETDRNRENDVPHRRHQATNAMVVKTTDGGAVASSKDALQQTFSMCGWVRCTASVRAAVPCPPYSAGVIGAGRARQNSFTSRLAMQPTTASREDDAELRRPAAS